MKEIPSEYNGEDAMRCPECNYGFEPHYGLRLSFGMCPKCFDRNKLDAHEQSVLDEMNAAFANLHRGWDEVKAGKKKIIFKNVGEESEYYDFVDPSTPGAMTYEEAFIPSNDERSPIRIRRPDSRRE